ncbi:hypothetical protein F5Y08DRAFT_342801 [Xylaria arbuscula]|nr:hypothetical protein F5Y08DRAFT_342801 [Xylaria arbuscula]
MGCIQQSTPQKGRTIGTSRGLQSPSEIDADTQKLLLYARLDSWLEKVRVSPDPDADPYFSDWNSSSDNAGSTSSSTRGSVLSSSKRQSIARQTKKENTENNVEIVSLEEGLRTRRVEFERSISDPKILELKNVIIPNTGDIEFEHMQSLRDKVALFFVKSRNPKGATAIYDIVEELSDAINQWKTTVHMPTITNREFEIDLKRCRYPYNAAVFQRTVMMSILNRHQIGDNFDFNCEGEWSLQSNYYTLPSRKTSGQAKNGFDDLTPALMANLHSSSQALLNIYVWMSTVGHQDTFFSDVRLFSIATNAQKFVLRVHRARASEDGEGLEYCYDDICKGIEYKRDNICHLIGNILTKYAEKTLLDILKSSVSIVQGKERQMQALKRKREVAGDMFSNKRATIAPSDQIGDPSASFGMSGVNFTAV